MELDVLTSQVENSLHCTHCDEEVVVALYNIDDENQANPFCCQGCRTVYGVIHQKGLTDYYEIKNNSKIYKRRSPVELKKEKFNYLDDSDFTLEYSYKNRDGLRTMEFYLEGIHCLACLWLVEKLPEFVNDVEHSRLDMGKSVATVTLKDNGLFSNVARELNNLGYRPHPLKKNEETVNLKKKEEHATLFKIGIAGAAAGNVMLYAICIYCGADGSFLKLFNLFTVILAFPVILYSAIPFYKSAWSALKKKQLNIDVPIAIALIAGFIQGLFNLIFKSGTNYLDTLCNLVFLLSMSRWLLSKIQEKGLNATDLNFFYHTTSVKKLEGSEFVEIHAKYLKVDDTILVEAGEIIPADGIILEGESNLNNSLLTGESLPIRSKKDDLVFSGTQNIDLPLTIKVLKTNADTRLGSILKEVESGWIHKARIVDFTNRLSKYFISAVFLLAALLIVMLVLQGKSNVALERAIALLIVTCPCALALATPVTLTNTLSRASKKGIIIKNDEVIEKLSEIKQVFLDKTGTITYGNMKVESLNLLEKTQLSIFDIIVTLEQKSNHPVARALKEYAKEKSPFRVLPVENWREIIGVGVSGSIVGKFYEIKNSKVFQDGKIIAEFKLRDQVRRDSKSAISIIENLGIKTHMISGDRTEIADEVGKMIGMNPINIHAEVSPEKKLEIIDNSDHALMIGDGANDAMALSKAYVGVAVCGSMDISLRAADVYLTTPGIFPLVDLIVISKETMKVIYRNLTISIIYNIISVIGVFAGVVSPLTAAIIMPLSSVSVLISTVIGTKALRQKLEEF